MEDKELKVVIYLIPLSVFMFVVLASSYAFNAGKDYSQRVSDKINSIELEIKTEFTNGKEIYCDNIIISKANKWNLDNEKNFFIRDENYIDISKCVDVNRIRVPIFG